MVGALLRGVEQDIFSSLPKSDMVIYGVESVKNKSKAVDTCKIIKKPVKKAEKNRFLIHISIRAVFVNILSRQFNLIEFRSKIDKFHLKDYKFLTYNNSKGEKSVPGIKRRKTAVEKPVRTRKTG